MSSNRKSGGQLNKGIMIKRRFCVGGNNGNVCDSVRKGLNIRRSNRHVRYEPEGSILLRVQLKFMAVQIKAQAPAAPGQKRFVELHQSTLTAPLRMGASAEIFESLGIYFVP